MGVSWKSKILYDARECEMVVDSTIPLCKKLGIKVQSRVKIVNAPIHYFDLLQPLPNGVIISNRLKNHIDIWHIFTKSKRNLSDKLKRAIDCISDNGMIWVSWPKKTSGIPRNITENEIRTVALSLGLVDVKVCTVDEVWSGLKLVIRKKSKMTLRSCV